MWAVVVARTSPTAKSRLSSVLNARERASLARAMLADVLDVCGHGGLDGCVGVVDDAEGVALAERAGALTVLDGGLDMNRAVVAGIQRAASHHPTCVLVLPGDVPLVTSEEIASLVEQSMGCPVVVARDRGGVGTNALVLRPPDALVPVFGLASARRHVAQARAKGLAACVLDLPGLGLDVDTPDDLRWLARHHPHGQTSLALARLSSVVDDPDAARAPVR